MLILKAPHPNYNITVVLPSPEWGNSVAGTASQQIIRSMDGSITTYTQTKDNRKKLQYSFRIARHKAIELQEFLKVYSGGPLKIIDHNDGSWVVFCTNNPFDFIDGERAYPFPGNEMQHITLEFEEKI